MSTNLLIRVVIVVALGAMFTSAARADDPGSQLIGCDQADNQVEVTVSSRLDPSCTWTRGVEITAPNVDFDCQGAHIVTTDKRTGILITTPTDVALSNITVRNCYVEGFLNNLRVTRDGFRSLVVGQEYENDYRNVLIEDSTFMNSRGVGVYVDAFVTGVTLRNLHIEGSGSAGIYLEGGSKGSTVENNQIVNNGYHENGPNGQFFEVGGVSFWFWGIGREGLAIDGSRDNQVLDNTFSGNSAGSIFLYKNCGEYVDTKPDTWWQRNYGATGNVIQGNQMNGEDYGVWVASRMGENTFPMDCSDPQYQPGVALDYASDNIVQGNTFVNVTYGVRVEDDRNTVANNQFISDNPADQAILIGTRFRTATLGQPVNGTAITGNQASITGNLNPYRWIDGHTNTTFTNNQSLGRLVGMCEGQQPAVGPFVFVVDLVVADPNNPPDDGPKSFPPPDPLPSCPLVCGTNGAAVAQPHLTIKNVDTPLGDDRLSFNGRITVAQPFDPPFDPVANGIGILIAGSDGLRLLDLTLPGGAYSAAGKSGWKVEPGRRWRYVNRSATAPGGITSVVIKSLTGKGAGLLDFTIKGRRGSLAADQRTLPLSGSVILDPPTAETGQCGMADFAQPTLNCSSSGGTVRCR